MKPIRIILILSLACFLMVVVFANAQDQTDGAAEKKKPSIAIPDELEDVMIREAPTYTGWHCHCLKKSRSLLVLWSSKARCWV